MQRTNRIYEESSRLSQGLVVGLSIAVVLMAGWLAATITLSPMATVEGAAEATSDAPGPAGAASLPTTLQQPTHSKSVHFDWPAEFASSTATQSAATPPAAMALPLAPEVPPTRDVGRTLWPTVPDARDRSAPSRPLAGAAAEATDAIVDILAPPALPRAGAAAAPPPRQPQPQRRQKPRVVETEPAAAQ
jgi:hypothetical protein